MISGIKPRIHDKSYKDSLLNMGDPIVVVDRADHKEMPEGVSSDERYQIRQKGSEMATAGSLKEINSILSEKTDLELYNDKERLSRKPYLFKD